MTHADLVTAAARWLKKRQGCTVVLTEQLHGTLNEIPDAIGWSCDRCIVVEAKVGVNDLRSDARKHHAKMGASLGDERWFITPKGLIDPDTTPHGHGLLELRGRSVFIVRPAPPRDVTWRRLRAECEFLRVELSDSWRAMRERAMAEGA